MSETPTSFGEDVPAPAAAPSMLDGLLADFAGAKDQHETTEFDVPGKQGVTVRYANDIPYEMIAAWRKSALGSPAPELRFGVSMLAWACRAIVADGQPVTDGTDTVTFTSSKLQTGLGVSSPTDAVRAFYGKDAYVLATYQAVLLAAGFGAEVSPTTR